MQGADVPVYEDQPPVVGVVVAGSPAERGGIRPQDRIVSVGGRRTDTWDQFFTAIGSRARRNVAIVLLREGRELTVQVVPDAETKYEIGEIGVMPDVHPHIRAVTAGDPADKAGLKTGDVIVEFDGRSVRSDRDLVSIVGNTAVGKKVSVRALRDGKSLSFDIKIAKRSEEKDEAAGEEEQEPAEKESGKARLGVRVQDVTKEIAEKLGLDEARGALVSDVSDGGPADRAGIDRGDVVLEVNRQPVEDAAAFAKLVRGAEPGKTLLLLVRGGGGTRFVTVKPEAAK
jgi:S1-C subfamily serine protease